MSMVVVRGDGVLSPVTLLALLVWLLNDHVLKRACPGLLSGKLSDLACLVVLPTALQALIEQLLPLQRPSRPLVYSCCAMLGLIFVAMEIWPPASLGYRYLLGFFQWPLHAFQAQSFVKLRPVRHWADLEDLIVLPVLLLPLWLGLRRVAGLPAILHRN